MAPKKNAFFMFMSSYRDSEKQKNQKLTSFQQLSQKLTPIWEVSTFIEVNSKCIIILKCE